MSYRQIKQLASIDTNLFVYLAAILQERHISRAAEAIGISQATMSYYLAKLRKQFDDPLLISAKGGMQLTTLAVKIEQDLSRWITLTEQMAGGYEFEPLTSSGVVSIAIEDTVASIILPRLMARLHESAPGLRLEHVSLSERGIESAFDEGVDLIFGQVKSAPADVHYQHVVDVELVVIAAKHHRLRAQPDMTLKQALRQPLLYFDMPGGAGRVIAKLMDNSKARADITLRSRSLPLLSNILIQGRELMIVPTTLIGLYFDREDYRVWPLKELQPVSMYCYWGAAVHNDPMVNWMRQQLMAVLLEVKQELGLK